MMWGIGLPKTGTISCTRAIAQLGYTVVHHVPNVIGLLNQKFRGVDFHAMVNCTDFPDFDAILPGGQFIYTERELEPWLASIDLHMNRRYRNCAAISPGFAYWRIKVFGAVNPTRRQFLDARRRHEDRVDQFFTHQPERLLRISICHGDGWEKLCPFLGKPVPPGVSFPFENAARLM